jgi:hypothetical protein
MSNSIGGTVTKQAAASVAFESYANEVRKTFADRPKTTKTGSLRVLLREDDLLRILVERAEARREFDELVIRTAECFRPLDPEKAKAKALRCARNYFRLSGFYADQFIGVEIDLKQASIRYCAAFEDGPVTIHYLAPIEFASFSSGEIDCGSFVIRRYDENALEAVLNKRNRRIFYPAAAVDVSRLAVYSFLHVTESLTVKPLQSVIQISCRVRMNFSNYPPVVVAALGKWSLFDWETASRQRAARALGLHLRKTAFSEWDAPFVPSIPFMLSVSESLIEEPPTAPNLTGLEQIEEDGSFLPLPGAHYDEPEFGNLREFITYVDLMLNGIEPYRSEWPFIDTALRWMVKADSRVGAEQLLWYITAIEAVLGTERPSLTTTLKKRVGMVVGNTPEQRKEAGRRFEQLYKFRSELVHGNPVIEDSKIYTGHVAEARTMARTAILWMLAYLAYVAKHVRTGGRLPNREEILDYVELDGPWLYRVLPERFPGTERWTRAQPA